MLDLLDHYAAAALAGLCANPERSTDHPTLVKQAYRIAQLMLGGRRALQTEEINMRRANYRDAIEWISRNDEPGERDPQAVSALISVMLVAELFAIESIRVAYDIIKLRSREEA